MSNFGDSSAGSVDSSIDGSRDGSIDGMMDGSRDGLCFFGGFFTLGIVR